MAKKKTSPDTKQQSYAADLEWAKVAVALVVLKAYMQAMKALAQGLRDG